MRHEENLETGGVLAIKKAKNRFGVGALCVQRAARVLRFGVGDVIAPVSERVSVEFEGRIGGPGQVDQ
jgi:hypothetical protein